MTSPEDSPIYTTGAVYTPSGGFWGKVAGGLGNIFSGIGHYAGEALPYIAKAVSVYGNAMSASSSSINSTVGNTGNSMIYQPSNVNLPRVAPIPITPVSVNLPKSLAPVRLQAFQNVTQQLNAGINPVRTTRINLLKALTQRTEYLENSQPSATTFHVSPIQASNGSLLPPQVQNNRSQASPWIQEQPYSIQGAQQPVSYAPLYQALARQSSAIADFTPPQYQRPMRLASPKPQSSLISLSAISKHSLAGPNKELLKQAKVSRLSEANFGQVELNLDLLKNAELLSAEHYDPLAMQAKALFGLNWLQHDGHFNNDGTITYRGIKTPAVLAPLLAYADADRYWKTDTHIRAEENWQQPAWKTAPEFVRAVFLHQTQGDTWLHVLYDWYFETGPAKRVYDASHPITRDLMNDEGVQQIRKDWIKAGKPNQFLKKLYTFGIVEYARELLTLDGTGSLLGSYRVSIERENRNLIKYTVENVTGWKSGTHMPPIIRDTVFFKAPKQKSTIEGMIFRNQPITIPESALEDRNRSEDGPGGNLMQQYTWYEKD
jgi:hypothetical protein